MPRLLTSSSAVSSVLSPVRLPQADSDSKQSIDATPSGVAALTSPFVPSSIEAVQQFLAFADITSDDIVCDLGCGDGRVLIAAARDRRARGQCPFIAVLEYLPFIRQAANCVLYLMRSSTI